MPIVVGRAVGGVVVGRVSIGSDGVCCVELQIRNETVPFLRCSIHIEERTYRLVSSEASAVCAARQPGSADG